MARLCKGGVGGRKLHRLCSVNPSQSAPLPIRLEVAFLSGSLSACRVPPSVRQFCSVGTCWNAISTSYATASHRISSTSFLQSFERDDNLFIMYTVDDMVSTDTLEMGDDY